MRKLACIVTGRRGKWLVLVVWLIAVFALFPVGSKLSDVTTDDTESFLPASAESTEVVQPPRRGLPRRARPTTAIVVYKRDGGLTAADKQKIARRRAGDPGGRQQTRSTSSAPPQIPFTPGAAPSLVSKNGDVATAIYTTPTDFEKEADWGQAIRDITHADTAGHAGLRHRRGRLRHRRPDVFSNLDTKLLLATVLLVLVLLGRDLPLGAGRAHPADRRLLRLHGRAGASSTCCAEVRRDGLLEQRPAS